jgi:ABC-type dipeptide/oligopeptide/nickel transport system permease subunit
MTNIQIEELESVSISSTNKRKMRKLIKFYLIPGYRNPDFSAEEYQIGKIKSKRRLFRRLLTPLTIVGMLMIFFIAILGVYSCWFTPYPLQELSRPFTPQGGDPFWRPTPDHPLGTTKYAYDILGRLVWGARTALTAAALPVLISTAGGLVVGTISAYFGGVVDSIIMRFCDFWFSFPLLILILIISPIVGQDLYNLLILYGLFYIPTSARWVRALVLQVRQNLYVRAAVTGGAEKFKVMFKHILPNAISPVIIAFFGSMAGAVLGFASIAYLGLGDETYADWGTDIAYAIDHKFTAFWALIWPGIFIAITAIGFMLIGDGLRDALDPRLHI